MAHFALALVNPHAAGGRAARMLPALRAALEHVAPGCRIELPASAEIARGLLQALPRGSRVLVAGGDGTVNQLLRAILDGDHVLALVPAGSGNDLSRALGIFGHPLESTLALLGQGAERSIDIGQVEYDDAEALFAANLTVGFDGAVCARALAGPKWLRGLPRYLFATFGELAALSNHILRVTADGALVHSGAALFASTLNTPTFGSGMPAVPDARIDDGHLNLLIAGQFSRLGALCMLPRLLKGTHLGDARIRTFPYEKLAIESREPLPFAVDGEYLGSAARLAVRVNQARLRVIVGDAAGI
ncbi:MAG: diacylglycerol/lipid kinase family protein [Burkholderiales bacterium]